MNRTFDRLKQFDERSRSFPIREVVLKQPRSYTWRVGAWLDQGKEGACVGFGWSHELAARPKPVVGLTNDTALAFYKEAQKADAYPGEDYSGTSVIAGAKVAKAKGYILEYRWGFGEPDLRLATGHTGPAVLGLNWYEGMFKPDANGFIHPTGNMVGGHCLIAYSVNLRGGFYWLHNSWGKDWGVNGACKITFEDMARLLDEDGEACVPIVRKLVGLPGQ